jgi:excisionase family DNA binding protein
MSVNMATKNQIQLNSIYSPSEAAQLVGVSRQTILSWCKVDKLRHTRHGYRTIRIIGKDLYNIIKYN